jgi:predicted dehydrogenase
MPQRVTGFVGLGKYHQIEVEDEVTAFFEYDNGMIGHFVTTTAESPGTNRLEIVGESGKLVFESGKLTFYRNRYSALEQIETATGGFDKVENWVVDVPFTHHGEPGHRFIIENFARAITDGETLVAPAPEGLNSVMMANAIIYSALTHQQVALPLDGDAYEAKLRELIATSDFKKPVRASGQPDVDMSSSF